MSPADRESPVVKLQKRVPGLMLGLSAAVLPALAADVWLNGADPDTQKARQPEGRCLRPGSFSVDAALASTPAAGRIDQLTNRKIPAATGD